MLSNAISNESPPVWTTRPPCSLVDQGSPQSAQTTQRTGVVQAD
jgi:hypothetical protein